MKVLTTRVEDELMKDLELIEREEKAERAEVARRLLAEGVRSWKLRKALEKISGGTWTIRRAAKFAGLTYYEMIEEMTKRGIDSGPTLSDLRE
jgi:predicted HTH domain antitoxin